MEDNTESKQNNVIEYTMGMGKTNLIALLLIIPISAVILIPYYLIWDSEVLYPGLDAFMDFFLIYFVAGIIVHELLHGLTWGYYASKGLKSIKFGIKWKFLTPYCHCKEPLKVKHYSIGAAMPLLILGVIPAIVGIIIGHGGFMSFGILFTVAAGGDIIALFMLRKLDRDVYISDHPSKMGFIRELEA